VASVACPLRHNLAATPGSRRSPPKEGAISSRAGSGPRSRWSTHPRPCHVDDLSNYNLNLKAPKPRRLARPRPQAEDHEPGSIADVEEGHG
jgi:hypothetical protein